jgi:hypothetical protein
LPLTIYAHVASRLIHPTGASSLTCNRADGELTPLYILHIPHCQIYKPKYGGGAARQTHVHRSTSTIQRSLASWRDRVCVASLLYNHRSFKFVPAATPLLVAIFTKFGRENLSNVVSNRTTSSKLPFVGSSPGITVLTVLVCRDIKFRHCASATFRSTFGRTAYRNCIPKLTYGLKRAKNTSLRPCESQEFFVICNSDASDHSIEVNDRL